MRKGFVFASVIGSISLASFILLGSAFGAHNLFGTNAKRASTYTLSLASQKISESTSPFDEEISSTVRTSSNNQIEIKCANVLDNNSGWQTILPGGYFYNPITSSDNHNKVTGIETISFSSNSSGPLSLSYGYTLDNESIIYSNEKELSPNVDYDLDGLNPTYFYIKNNNNTSIEITDFSIGYSCSETEYPKQDLNILMIGNSFADDTVYYSERVANSYGINLHLYDAYIGGCTINTHYENFNNDNATYSMRSMNGSSWNYSDNKTLKEIINSHTWDIITFQQASAEVGRSESFVHLGDLVSSVRSLVGPTPKFYWHQTWAYDADYQDYYDYFAYFNNNQMAMYNAIIDCYTSQVASLSVFDKTIFAGTAVQNLRTSYMKNTFSRDGKHMSVVHGRYLLALNFVSTIFDIDLDKSPCAFLPVEIDPSYTKVAYEAVKNAWKSPLNCTNSLYPTKELTNYDLSEFTEIDAELVGCSYWDSTDSAKYNQRLSNNSGISNLYTSTKRFTSETLPVGSLVVVGDSFGVVPEAWTSDSQQASNQSDNYSDIIEIDSSFWNGYQYRAFNIFKASRTELLGQYDQIFDTFHVYVPNSMMGGLTPKTYNPDYSSDSILFSNNGFNISYFSKLHLDPITGFYKCDDYYELRNSYIDGTAQKFVCSRPFYGAFGDLPERTVIIVDSGYQWRSDCWRANGKYSPRPDNVNKRFTILDSSFWGDGITRRTFNVSSTSSSYVYQNYISFMRHLRIYVPNANLPDTPVNSITLSENTVSLFEGQTRQLVATILPKYATNKNVTWYSSDTSVATVTSNGLISAVSPGITTISVITEDGGYVASCNVTIYSASTVFPDGTYSSQVTIDSTSYNLVFYLGNQSSSSYAVMLSGTNLNASSIQIDNITDEIVISTSRYINSHLVSEIRCIYDSQNHALTDIYIDGDISSFVSNNGNITATIPQTNSSCFFADCDGTTSELQTLFKRRYMKDYSWQVDNSNSDRFVSDTTNYFSGTGAVKRRGYSGGAVSLNLNSDFASPKAVKQLQFWVYNPSSSDITMRSWVYRASNFGENSELATSVAEANSWTFVTLAINNLSVYNFQIADFTNSGVNLTFDNIYLF